MSQLLELLEHEANKAYRGDAADFELLHDIMRYMTVYPDTVHHRKEDRIYAEIHAVRPDLAGGMSRVGTDHRELARLGSTLRDEIEQVLAGQVIRRDAIVADLLRYINLLREHMRWEERDLFLRIEEMIRDGHTTLGSAKVVEVADPVFGQAVERHFARLLDTLRE